MPFVSELAAIFFGVRHFAVGLRRNFAPERDARMHLVFHEFRREGEAEIGVLLLGEKVGGIFERRGIGPDDDAVLVHGPEVFITFPAIEGLAVEQFERLVLPFAGRDDRGLFLVCGGGGCRTEGECEETGKQRTHR